MLLRSQLMCLAGCAVAIGSAFQVAAQSNIEIAFQARAVQPGEVVVVTITAPAEAKSLKVSAFNRNVPVWRVDAQRWQGLIGIDMEAKPGKYPVLVEQGPPQLVLEVKPIEFRTRRLKVNPDFVNPPASVRPRIEADAKLLAHTWTLSARERLWGEGFAAPVPQEANSAFGTLSIYNGETRTRHGGTDFLSPEGTPVHAPAPGRVMLTQDLYFTGNTVVIDHGFGLFSLFAHLSKVEVKDGAVVAAGDVLGLVGATGRVTGPHLHWTVRLNGARVDPLSLIAALKD